MRDFGSDIFAGAAKYYARFRPKYPPEMFNDIVRVFGLDGHGRLLDLGCGTGELAIPLARYFERVLAIDPDLDMLAVARRKAESLRINNISWEKGSSRDLRSLKGYFKLATLGQSLHWMDETAVLKELFNQVEPKGGVFVVGSIPIAQNKLSTAKDELIKQLVAKYLGPERRVGGSIYRPSGQSWENDVFPNSPFGDFIKREYLIDFVQNVDQVVSELYSKSWAIRAHFGNELEDFDNEIRAGLAAISKGRDFESKLRFEAFFLRKR